MATPLPLATDAARDACWNRIGIHGDASCPQLERYVHCRNCPVYSAAATTLLDGALPPDYRAHWTEHVARVQEPAQAGMQSMVVFRLRGEWLGLASTLFEEVATTRKLHTLPHRRNGVVLGIANVRGELRACISLARLLGLQDAAEDAAAAAPRLLVVRAQAQPVAFPVDEVHGTHRYDPRELQQRPATIAFAASAYTSAVLPWRQGFVGLLDAGPLLRAIDRSLASASAI